MNERFETYYKNGFRAENRFSTLLKQKFGGDIIPSSRQVDIRDHVDFTWVRTNGAAIKFDVKSHKPNNNMIIDTEWVELKNVNGDDGWVYGKADFIAYEREMFWLVIAREELATITEAFVKNKCATSCNTDLCAPYTRKDRKDIVVRIPFSEMMIRGRILWKNDRYDIFKPRIESAI